MKTDLKTLLENAKHDVATISVQLAKEKINDSNYVFIDVREKAELEIDGVIEGAVHIPRGMLEFTLDSSSPYFNPVFDSAKNFVFFCKSGGRSLLSAHRAIEMGLSNVSNMEGGFLAWKSKE